MGKNYSKVVSKMFFNDIQDLRFREMFKPGEAMYNVQLVSIHVR